MRARSFALLLLLLPLAACEAAAPEDGGSSGGAGAPGGAGGLGGLGGGGDGGAAGAGGSCAPARPCAPDCDPCTGLCDRGSYDPQSCTCAFEGVRRLVALVVTPASVTLEAESTVALRALGRFEDCSEAELTASVEWRVDDESVATIAPDGTLTGTSAGTTAVRAASGSVTSADVAVTVTGGVVEPPPGELRGLWITRFAFGSQAELEGIIDRAADAGFNAVFVQIRGNGDAYYRSALVPWARGLSGTLGRDPGWDPLQVAIDRAHARGMQLHAYFNALSAWPVSSGAVPRAEGAAQHVLFEHPEWLAVTAAGVNEDGEYLWLTPGNPAVRAHLEAAVEELLTDYEVDGLHLDRIRSPARTYSHDAVTEAAYDAARALDPALTWDDFMREQVNATVASIHAAVTRARPTAALSAAVWGIYQPLPGCRTSEGYGGYHQDSLAWLERGTMDALAPMIYWPIEAGACTDWATLSDLFVAGAAGRHVWAGMHALDAQAFDFPSIEARIAHSRGNGAQGTVVFASTYLDQGEGRWAPFSGTEAAPGPYATPIATPVMPWK